MQLHLIRFLPCEWEGSLRKRWTDRSPDVETGKTTEYWFIRPFADAVVGHVAIMSDEWRAEILGIRMQIGSCQGRPREAVY